MRKEIFYDSLKIAISTRICIENHSSVTGWQKLFFPTQILLIFGDRCISLLLKYKAGNLTVI